MERQASWWNEDIKILLDEKKRISEEKLNSEEEKSKNEEFKVLKEGK